MVHALVGLQYIESLVDEGLNTLCAVHSEEGGESLLDDRSIDWALPLDYCENQVVVGA